MKLLFPILLIGIAILSLGSCKKCKGEDPAARIINNGTITVSVQVSTSGNIFNIFNVEPGKSSPYASYTPGWEFFSITVANDHYTYAMQMEECFDYDIAIDANNHITAIAIDRND